MFGSSYFIRRFEFRERGLHVGSIASSCVQPIRCRKRQCRCVGGEVTCQSVSIQFAANAALVENSNLLRFTRNLSSHFSCINNAIIIIIIMSSLLRENQRVSKGHAHTRAHTHTQPLLCYHQVVCINKTNVLHFVFVFFSGSTKMKSDS